MGTEYLNNRVFEGIIGRFQKAIKSKARCELIIEDIRDTIDRKAVRNSDVFKDEEVLDAQNTVYGSLCTEFSDSQKELANAFYTLSENIVRYAKFHLIDEDDAVQEGVMICFEKIDRFDPRKGKAFNYMTTCILNHFRQLYRTARNYNELKRKYLSHLQKKSERTIIKNGKELPVYSNGTKDKKLSI
jgi:hypothetical protein